MILKFFSTKLSKAIIVIAIFSFLVYLNPRGVFDGLRAGIFKIVYPIQKISYVSSSGIRSVGELVSSIGKIRRENEYLIEENLKLEAENRMLEDVEIENQILREQIGLLPRGEFIFQSAQLIGQDVNGLGNWIFINKGSKHGIKKGMPVVVSNSALVGKIDEVFSGSSKVMLITNPGSVINGVVSATEAKGILKGKHGLGLAFDMVLQTDIIQTGDAVITSGIGEGFPRGLLLGKIQEVQSSHDHLFQQAIVSPPTKLSKLRFVFVITGKK